MAAFTEQQKTEFSMQKWYDLSGKTAVVTGGITGLGLAITRCLVSAGAKVIALSRTDEKKGNEILKEFGGKAVFYQFDITDTDHAQVIADRIQKEQGPVDILVNNAGNHCKKYIWDMSVEDYKNVLDVHLVGAFALTKAFIPQMKERGWGKINFPGQHDKLYWTAAGMWLFYRKSRISWSDPYLDSGGGRNTGSQ